MSGIPDLIWAWIPFSKPKLFWGGKMIVLQRGKNHFSVNSGIKVYHKASYMGKKKKSIKNKDENLFQGSNKSYL